MHPGTEQTLNTKGVLFQANESLSLESYHLQQGYINSRAFFFSVAYRVWGRISNLNHQGSHPSPSASFSTIALQTLP